MRTTIKKVNKLLSCSNRKNENQYQCKKFRKKKPNRNGKVGIKKNNNYAYVKNVPRKICNEL